MPAFHRQRATPRASVVHLPVAASTHYFIHMKLESHLSWRGPASDKILKILKEFVYSVATMIISRDPPESSSYVLGIPTVMTFEELPSGLVHCSVTHADIVCSPLSPELVILVGDPVTCSCMQCTASDTSSMTCHDRSCVRGHRDVYECVCIHVLWRDA